MTAGEVLESVKTAIESSMGVWGLTLIAMTIVTVVYIKTESLLLTAFVWFIVLIGLAGLYRLENIPIFVVMMVALVALVIYDTFIRDKYNIR